MTFPMVLWAGCLVLGLRFRAPGALLWTLLVWLVGLAFLPNKTEVYLTAVSPLLYLLGAWIGSRDIRKLEAEGRELESLLRGGDVQESGESETARRDEPRFSRKAIVGMLLVPAFVLSVSLTMLCIVGGGNRVTVLAIFVGLPGLIISFLTTFLGFIALSDIRHSKGRVTGLGLAVADAVVFPLLILNGAIFSVLLFFNHMTRQGVRRIAWLSSTGHTPGPPSPG